MRRGRHGDPLLPDHDRRRHPCLVEQERILPDRRRHRRPAAGAGGSAGPRSARRGDLAREQLQCLAERMCRAHAQYRLARGERPVVRVRTVAALGAQHFDERRAVIGPTEPPEHRPGARQDRVAGAPRLGDRVESDDRQLRAAAETFGESGADLVGRARRAAARAAHPHAIFTDCRHRHRGEVAGDVRQQVGSGIADLVEHLLGHDRRRHLAARAGGLADDEAAVGFAFDDRVADSGPVGHRLPVGVQPAGGLAAALDDVAGEAAAREPVVVVAGPAELVHQHAQRHRRVDAAPGDHHLRARVERGTDRRCAEIRVGAQHSLRQRRPAVHLAHAFVAQRRQQRHHVVALDHRDAQFDALLGRQRRERARAPVRIHAAGVADHADAARRDLAQHRLHRDVDEVGGIAGLGPLQPRAGEDRHRELGEVVEHQVVDFAAGHELRRGHRAVAPEARGAADPDDAGPRACLRDVLLPGVHVRRGVLCWPPLPQGTRSAARRGAVHAARGRRPAPLASRRPAARRRVAPGSRWPRPRRARTRRSSDRRACAPA